MLFKLLLHAKTFSYINEDLYGYRINEQSVTHRLPDSVWNDAARAFNAILSYAKENGMTITDRDIAIARSELRRNMMKLAIIKKQWQYYEDTDREMARYLPQSFWKDIAYSTRLKHKVGFIAYHVLDWYYNTFK